MMYGMPGWRIPEASMAPSVHKLFLFAVYDIVRRFRGRAAHFRQSVAQFLEGRAVFLGANCFSIAALFSRCRSSDWL